MSKQNVYDNQVFYDGYQQIRNKSDNANEIIEKPALFSLLPELKGKTILDLGCGYGENCNKFVECGAEKVIGIDISEKMLEVAKSRNSNVNIEYKNIPIEDINTLEPGFNLVISSLAVHYVKDFSKLVLTVYDLLSENGMFIFSQENPLNTCFTNGDRWTRDTNGKKIYANISNYGLDGKRESKWIVDNVIKYHRTFSTIINSLTEAGFEIEKCIEPVATDEILEKHPEYIDLFHKPDFLLVKAIKPKKTV